MNKMKVLSLVLSALLLMPGAVYAKGNKDVHGKSVVEKPAVVQKASEMTKASANEQEQKQDMHVEDASKAENSAAKQDVKSEASDATPENGKVESHKLEAQQNRDAKRAEISTFKDAMKAKHLAMKTLRQQTIALRQTVEQETEELAGIINDLQSGKKTLPGDMLTNLLAEAQNLKLDEEQVKATSEISTEVNDTQARVKGEDFNNALASMDKVIAKYQKRLDALTQLDTDLKAALEIARQAVVPAPAETTTSTSATTSTTPTTTQDQTQSTSGSTSTDTQSTTTGSDTTNSNATDSTNTSSSLIGTDTSSTTTSTP